MPSLAEVSDHPVVEIESWRTWAEPMPDARSDAPIESAEPIEQLLPTGDRSDYSVSRTRGMTPVDDYGLWLATSRRSR